MAKTTRTSQTPTNRMKPPAISPEAREQQLIAYAMEQAEEQLANHTAPSSVLVHYLKLGTTEKKLEMKKAELELELIKAKTEAMKSMQNIEELYKDAMSAFKEYRGDRDEDEIAVD